MATSPPTTASRPVIDRVRSTDSLTAPPLLDPPLVDPPPVDPPPVAPPPVDPAFPGWADPGWPGSGSATILLSPPLLLPICAYIRGRDHRLESKHDDRRIAPLVMLWVGLARYATSMAR